MASTPKSIDDYIAGFPSDVRKILESIRTTIKRAAPHADETIKYGIPTFTYHGNLVHFAAFKKHIGFYPRVSGIATFKKELAHFKGEKGSVQFPLDRPMPLKLIREMVRFRAAENRERAARAASSKTRAKQ